MMYVSKYLLKLIIPIAMWIIKLIYLLSNSVISCNQPVVPGAHPTNVQSRIREKNFKPLKLPSTLHPYPPKFLEYLPLFIGEDHITAEKHLRDFQNFIDNLEIMHEDVVMRLFSKSLVGDVALWFKNLEVGSIGSWVELYGAFSRYWGENKSFDQYLTEFYALRREKDEVLTTFNMRFYSFICSMPLEIRPSEIVAMVYYIEAQHPNLVLFLRERRSSSLAQLFVDAEEIEENFWACNRLRDQAYVEDLHAHEQEEGCKHKSDLGSHHFHIFLLIGT
jgi:hypothetical protein